MSRNLDAGEEGGRTCSATLYRRPSDHVTRRHINFCLVSTTASASLLAISASTTSALPCCITAAPNPHPPSWPSSTSTPATVHWRAMSGTSSDITSPSQRVMRCVVQTQCHSPFSNPEADITMKVHMIVSIHISFCFIASPCTRSPSHRSVRQTLHPAWYPSPRCSREAGLIYTGELPFLTHAGMPINCTSMPFLSCS